MRYLLIHYLDETAELSQADDSGAEGSVAAREFHDWGTEMETSGVKLYGGALPAGQPGRDGTDPRRRGAGQ